MDNRQAFLDLIAFSEGTANKGDDGYNVIVGGTLFKSYKDHPRKLVHLPALNINSTAAGRYQVLARFFDFYKAMLKLPDFSPESQDAIALQQIKECHALDDIDTGNIAEAIKKCKNIWASFPGAGYGQYEQHLDILLSEFVKLGGIVNA